MWRWAENARGRDLVLSVLGDGGSMATKPPLRVQWMARECGTAGQSDRLRCDRYYATEAGIELKGSANTLTTKRGPDGKHSRPLRTLY